MFDEQPNMQGAPQDSGQMAGGQPYYDPYQIEQARQEIELAHEEFQRLLNGRPRLYSQFR